jgi:hypothetical protein
VSTLITEFQAMHVANEEAKNAEDQKKAKEMEVSSKSLNGLIQR